MTFVATMWKIWNLRELMFIRQLEGHISRLSEKAINCIKRLRDAKSN